MTKERKAVSTLLYVLVCLFAITAQHTSASQHTVPFVDNVGPMPIVNAKLPGNLTLRAVIYTAANVSSISRATVEKYGLPTIRAKVNDRANASNAHEWQAVKLEHMLIGGVELSGEFLVDDPFVVPANVLQQQYDIRIGTDQLRKFAVYIDYPGRNLALLPDSAVTPDFLQSVELTGVYTTHLDNFKPGDDFFSVTTNSDGGLKFASVIDTGSETSEIWPQAASQLHAKPIGPIYWPVDGNDFEAQLYNLRTLQLGVVSFSNVSFVSVHGVPEDHIPNTIAADVLQNTRLLINLKHDTMYLRQADTLSRPPRRYKINPISADALQLTYDRKSTMTVADAGGKNHVETNSARYEVLYSATAGDGTRKLSYLGSYKAAPASYKALAGEFSYSQKVGSQNEILEDSRITGDGDGLMGAIIEIHNAFVPPTGLAIGSIFRQLVRLTPFSKYLYDQERVSEVISTNGKTEVKITGTLIKRFDKDVWCVGKYWRIVDTVTGTVSERDETIDILFPGNAPEGITTHISNHEVLVKAPSTKEK